MKTRKGAFCCSLHGEHDAVVGERVARSTTENENAQRAIATTIEARGPQLRAMGADDAGERDEEKGNAGNRLELTGKR